MIIESDTIIILASSLLALVLFTIAFLAYLRERRKKLFLLSAAFFVYAVMEFFDAGDIFSPGIGKCLEIWGSLLNFVVLTLFFISIIIRE